MIIDISPVLDESLAVFPGDTPFQREIILDFQKGHHLALSSIKTTLHAGAHLDAPSHYHPEGMSIDQMPLSPFIGLCWVVDLTGNQGPIGPDDLDSLPPGVRRVLFKTNSFSPHEQWQSEFSHLTPEAVQILSEKGVCLVGIDTPSMDESSSQDLLAHKEFFKCGLLILEGLVLTEVKAGPYYLIALPLKIKGGEASPVRAVLLSDLDTFKS